MSWSGAKDPFSQGNHPEAGLKGDTSCENLEATSGEDKAKVKRYRNKHMKQFPELYRSDVSIHPSYTGLKTLPYYVVCRRRVYKTRKQITRQLNWEIRHMAMMQTYALGGVRLDRTFSIGFPQDALVIPDLATDKERRRINELVKNGNIRRVVDEEIISLALELIGTNVSTTYIFSPKTPRGALGICLPFMIMIIKNLKRYFTFEITILDDQNMHRRFRASNFERITRVRPFCTSMPICLAPGWNQVQFNLAEFTRRAYDTNYVETTRMQIHANCRLRRVYFSDKLYRDEELPEEYTLQFPSCKAERKEEVGSKKSSKTSVGRASRASAGYGEEYGEYGEYGGYKEYVQELLASSVPSRTPASSEGSARLSVHVPLGSFEEEDTDEGTERPSELETERIVQEEILGEPAETQRKSEGNEEDEEPLREVLPEDEEREDEVKLEEHEVEVELTEVAEEDDGDDQEEVEGQTIVEEI